MEENKNLEEVTEETATETVEEVAKETAAETVEEVAEETVTETVEEVAEETTCETAEEKMEDVLEEANPDEDEEMMVGEEETEKKIKPKKKLDKTNIIIITVCAIVVIACVVFFGITQGWFNFLKSGKIEIPDYKNNGIEVVKQQVETSDELVDQYIEQLLSNNATSQKITEGVVEDGDTVNIDYAGKIAETGVAFDGGTAQGQDLVIGSGSFIEGFEDQLIGAQLGTTKTINVTFPESYGNPELAGVAATFDVTLNYKTISVAPELTDKWVKENGKHFIPGEFSNVKEFKAAMKEFITKMQLHTAMFSDIQSKQKIEEYNPKDLKDLKEFLMKKFEEEAAYYQYDVENLAQMYGAESADAYVESEAKTYLEMMMPIEKIFKQENLKVTDEQVNEYLQRYIYQQGMGERFTVDEVVELQGEYWLKLYKTLEVKYDIAMTALEKYVKYVDAPTEEPSSAQ